MVAGVGDPQLKQGFAIYLDAANKNIERTAFYSSDGDFLIVQQEGTLFITTELGKFTVAQREICLLPLRLSSLLIPTCNLAGT